MQYFVTYGVMDSSLGSNPLWHAFLFVSKRDETTGRAPDVVYRIGFYSLPSTGDKGSAWVRLKGKLGFTFDIQGNHGIFRPEEIRYLDAGHGLHGANFEVTKENAEALINKCEEIMLGQRAAIEEIAGSLRLPAKPRGTAHIYDYEHHSQIIFIEEQTRALQENRQPRLKPFGLELSLTVWGPSFEKSSTCKTQVLDLFKGILTDKQIERLSGYKIVPRYSGPMEEILLYSEGELLVHEKKGGDKVLYRRSDTCQEDLQTKLRWAVPPQEVEYLTDKSSSMQMDKKYIKEIKSIVSQLMKLEWLFINASVAAEYQNAKNELISLIHSTYEAFARDISSSQRVFADDQKSALSRFSQWLFSPSRNELYQKINHAKCLINVIYTAAVDQADDLDDCVSVVSLLSMKEKKSLCSIIGRSYIELEEDEGLNLHCS